MKAEATSRANEMLGARVYDLAASARLDELYDLFPEVKDAFVRASAKQQAKERQIGNVLDKPRLKAPIVSS